MIDINLRRMATRVISIRRFLWFTFAIPRESWDVSGNEGDGLRGVEWGGIRVISRPKHGLEGRDLWGDIKAIWRAGFEVPGLYNSRHQTAAGNEERKPEWAGRKRKTDGSYPHGTHTFKPPTDPNEPPF
jgi:hypothetical protein